MHGLADHMHYSILMCMITLTFELLKGGGSALISNAESGLLILTTLKYIYVYLKH